MMSKEIDAVEMLSLIMSKYIDEEVAITLLRKSKLDKKKKDEGIRRVKQRTKFDIARIELGGKELIHRIK